ncbi:MULTISPECIES: BtpA/SgcQ family protein [Pseudothermotoga]|uniref:Photosystem I assembly BtpA n=1 Tax=Pseudothermotoga lettingae (strain ATCC BAA-301 / DSM 14385 / NBRC 107922 / TMO) TaxID=416591 RepID=A8F746_PSELT|nr:MULTISPECIES: BtpA/SgcQ family protein [Pseudothermotoga]ABV33980.1 photosystem I assembly BtpA [Pseudothermotoga lettingae TMO]MDK2884605.1 uncharacterized protein [Pseudothermotoga sp.]GLI49081.1 sgc region protein SgcQ [Pseudothermotoga lettingae TMO]
MQNWLEEMFKVKKPFIGMCHLLPLPGDPYYSDGDLKQVIEWAKRDLMALQNGGVDGVLFSNEFSMPYVTKVPTVTVACMARIIGELRTYIKVPFGVDVLWDPIATLDLAVAVDAYFVREVFSGVYASDFGLWNLNFGEVARHRRAIGAQKVRLLFNIVPESARYLADREPVEIAKSTVFNHRPDALCVSGLTAGVPANTSTLQKIKEVLPDVIIFANTGVCIENVEEIIRVADGAIVGTAFKYDKRFENHVDENRVKELMDKVKSLRART